MSEPTLLTVHQRLLAPYVTGSWCRRDGGSILYLRDSGAIGGTQSKRCRDATITALCDAGILEEEQTATGGIRDCTTRRSIAAGPALDLSGDEDGKPWHVCTCQHDAGSHARTTGYCVANSSRGTRCRCKAFVARPAPSTTGGERE